MKKFRYIVDLILRNIRNTELYDKEDINGACKDVYAMKLFKNGQNARLYCKQQKTSTGTLYVIVGELLEKKKNNRVHNEEKALITKVSTYEYEIKERNP